ncbi:hypothetical protein E2C01_026089 [Portunus trituberculatus]|uniref:Uncharacterized protein n=1 Tax=Portunus trituberculatus TaxID=210409 RepID=A0A5B7EEU2_PORTR|nr:hypothetical protein [Portunus trituberculatus]
MVASVEDRMSLPQRRNIFQHAFTERELGGRSASLQRVGGSGRPLASAHHTVRSSLPRPHPRSDQHTPHSPATEEVFLEHISSILTLLKTFSSFINNGRPFLTLI